MTNFKDFNNILSNIIDSNFKNINEYKESLETLLLNTLVEDVPVLTNLELKNKEILKDLLPKIQDSLDLFIVNGELLTIDKISNINNTSLSIRIEPFKYAVKDYEDSSTFSSTLKDDKDLQDSYNIKDANIIEDKANPNLQYLYIRKDFNNKEIKPIYIFKRKDDSNGFSIKIINHNKKPLPTMYYFEEKDLYSKIIEDINLCYEQEEKSSQKILNNFVINNTNVDETFNKENPNNIKFQCHNGYWVILKTNNNNNDIIIQILDSKEQRVPEDLTNKESISINQDLDYTSTLLNINKIAKLDSSYNNRISAKDVITQEEFPKIYEIINNTDIDNKSNDDFNVTYKYDFKLNNETIPVLLKFTKISNVNKSLHAQCFLQIKNEQFSNLSIQATEEKLEDALNLDNLLNDKNFIFNKEKNKDLPKEDQYSFYNYVCKNGFTLVIYKYLNRNPVQYTYSCKKFNSILKIYENYSKGPQLKEPTSNIDDVRRAIKETKNIKIFHSDYNLIKDCNEADFTKKDVEPLFINNKINPEANLHIDFINKRMKNFSVKIYPVTINKTMYLGFSIITSGKNMSFNGNQKNLYGKTVSELEQEFNNFKGALPVPGFSGEHALENTLAFLNYLKNDYNGSVGDKIINDINNAESNEDAEDISLNKYLGSQNNNPLFNETNKIQDILKYTYPSDPLITLSDIKIGNEAKTVMFFCFNEGLWVDNNTKQVKTDTTIHTGRSTVFEIRPYITNENKIDNNHWFVIPYKCEQDNNKIKYAGDDIVDGKPLKEHSSYKNVKSETNLLKIINKFKDKVYIPDDKQSDSGKINIERFIKNETLREGIINLISYKDIANNSLFSNKYIVSEGNLLNVDFINSDINSALFIVIPKDSNDFNNILFYYLSNSTSGKDKSLYTCKKYKAEINTEGLLNNYNLKETDTLISFKQNKLNNLNTWVDFINNEVTNSNEDKKEVSSLKIKDILSVIRDKYSEKFESIKPVLNKDDLKIEDIKENNFLIINSNKKNNIYFLKIITKKDKFSFKAYNFNKDSQSLEELPAKLPEFTQEDLYNKLLNAYFN